MIDFDVGDYVVCIKSEIGYRLQEKQFYEILNIDRGENGEDTFVQVFKDNDCDYVSTRFRKVIPYSRLNETLYPDYVKVTLDKKDYLLPKNVKI